MSPLEGGFEGRYQRRLRAAGYYTLHLAAPGLGDLASYLTAVHGVRPAHLGKTPLRTYFVPPVASYTLENLPPKTKGLALWMIDGRRLSREELQYLCNLPADDPRIKVVIELGGDRIFRWQPLKQIVAAA